LRSHLKIVGAGRVTCSKFYTEGQQILGDIVHNLIARDFCTPGIKTHTYLDNES